MTRKFALALATGALLVLLAGAGTVAAGSSGANYGACVAGHARTEGGFSGSHNPGMHRGFSGWHACPDA